VIFSFGFLYYVPKTHKLLDSDGHKYKSAWSYKTRRMLLLFCCRIAKWHMHPEYELCATSVSDESIHVQDSSGHRGVYGRGCLCAPHCTLSDKCLCLFGGLCCFGLVACETCFGLFLGKQQRKAVLTHTWGFFFAFCCIRKAVHACHMHPPVCCDINFYCSGAYLFVPKHTQTPR